MLWWKRSRWKHFCLSLFAMACLTTVLFLRGVPTTTLQMAPLDGPIKPGYTFQDSTYQDLTRDMDNMGTWPLPNLNSSIMTPSCSLSHDLLKWVHKVQKQRRHLVSEMCKLHPPTENITTSMLRKIIVDDQHKMLYCVVPKVGCTIWKQILVSHSKTYGRNFTINGLLVKDNVHSDKYLRLMGLRYLSEYTKQEIFDRVRTYYKFMFVRHPLERILSAYRDKFTQYNKFTKFFQYKYGRVITRMYRRNATNEALTHGDDVTFPEFVHYVTNLGNLRSFNPHWAPYHNLCHPCKIQYDYIGKMETIDLDAPYVMSKLGKLECNYTKFPSSHKSNPPTEVVMEQYYRNISNSELEKLIQTYRDDFLLFDYKQSLPRKR